MRNFFTVCISLILMAGILKTETSGVFKRAEDLPSTELYQTYKYAGEVPHFFTHQMINDSKKAFSYDNQLKYHYDKDCMTAVEFERFLKEMYDNNYCLIDIYDVVGFDGGTPYFKDIYIPFNKKPFCLSFDDMSYDSRGLGMSDKIILDHEGRLASYTESHLPQIEYDKESVCILENFIAKHPDFSFRNARAIICPTGYNGIMGYRINKESRIDRSEEIEAIKPLIEKLKNLGYRFASHTFNHISVTYSSMQMLYLDCLKYQEEILPIIGGTDIFCFPCGNALRSGGKLEILKSFGFKIFLCVGSRLDNRQENESVFIFRKVLDGNAFRSFRKEYLKYFDTFKVYEHENRKIKLIGKY